MELKDAILGRRNVKLFKSEAVDLEQLMSMFEAARYAPNHRMTEPWEIVLVGPETRKKLNHKADFGGAPVVFAVLSKGASNPIDRDEDVIATACFVQNFLLQAYEAGLGVRWASLGALPQNREILGVPDGYAVIGVFGVGIPEEIPQAKPRTPMTAKIRSTL